MVKLEEYAKKFVREAKLNVEEILEELSSISPTNYHPHDDEYHMYYTLNEDIDDVLEKENYSDILTCLDNKIEKWKKLRFDSEQQDKVLDSLVAIRDSIKYLKHNMEIEHFNLYQKIIDNWRIESQKRALVEECAELIAVIMKETRTNRNDIKDKDIIEEIAGVEILLEQMRTYYGSEVIEEAKEKQMKKLRKYVEE